MKKILVLGAYGMAGHMIYMYLERLNKYKMYNTVHNKPLNDESIVCDVLDNKKLYEVIDNISPDVIINCIGILNNKSDVNVGITSFINSFLPHYLENICFEKNIKLIHLSTDCVFKGDKGDYKDTDRKDENGIYGLSKSIGEVINNKDLTIRTSIIGPELKEIKTGLFDWFINQRGYIDGYKNVYWSGVTTLELAKAIDVFISEDITGLYQLSYGEKISKYDLLNLIKIEFDKSYINIREYEDLYVDKSMICSNKSMFKVNSYEQMIKDLKKWMNKYKHIYE